MDCEYVAACCSIGQKKEGVEKGPVCLQENTDISFKNIISNNDFLNGDGYQKLYDCVKENIGKFQIIVGGDHSIAIGSVGALIDHYNSINKKLFVIWIDAHADINTYDTSETKNIHGMPVAFLMNLCQQNIITLNTHLKPHQIIYIGLRDIDPPEHEFLNMYNIKYYTMKNILKNGLNNILNEINQIVGNEDIHISLDIDGIDPLFCPSTGTPVSNGLSDKDTISIINNFNKKIVSCDIVEFNPFESTHTGMIHTISIIQKLINEMIKNKK